MVPRHQHTAVDRNRLKRRLRELARLKLLPALREGAPSDIAIRARREAYGAPMEALSADVAAIVKVVEAVPRMNPAENETGA